MKKTTMAFVLAWAGAACAADDFPKPYSPPCVERENVFEFTEKPKVKNLGNDKYEITFAVKGNCDVTVGLVDEQGKVVRHLGSGVLGANAPAPFQKNSLRQTIYWNGKDDLDVYHKEPGKLKVRVWLGLKPEFDKRLGGTSPKNMPGVAWGIVATEKGVVVLTKTVSNWGIHFARRFDHDGNYVGTIVPPPANLPEEKLKGLGAIEYEKGQRAIHSRAFDSTVWGKGEWLPMGFFNTPLTCIPAVVGDRIYYAATGGKAEMTWLHYFGVDGSVDEAGAAGRQFVARDVGAKWAPMRFAVSPDGWMYCGILGGTYYPHMVLRMKPDDKGPAQPFLGEPAKPGSDNAHFNSVADVECDSQGRIYVADHMNNRIQVFSADAKCVKTIPIDRPLQVKVHRKTGAIYVQHLARVQGTTRSRVSKLTSLENPAVAAYVDHPTALMALDSWTAKPRIWLAGRTGAAGNVGGEVMFDDCWIKIWEDDGTALRKIADFEEDVRKEDGKSFVGPWSGQDIGGSGCHGKIVCDPVREQVYYRNSMVWDLRTGQFQGCMHFPGSTDDIAFDKKGFLHAHFNPGFATPGVYRLDPSARKASPKNLTPFGETFAYAEVPYDYGVEPRSPGMKLLGILPVRDQPGAKFFSDGVGVTMQGSVAEVCNIYYAPKRSDEMDSFGLAGERETAAVGLRISDDDGNNYQSFVKSIGEMQKRGEEVYFIRPKPGISLMGGTIWTWEVSGEVREACAVTAGELINGSMIDEDGSLYFVNNRTRWVNGKSFLSDRGTIIGGGRSGKAETPFTGTLLKTRGKGAEILSLHSPIPMDGKPEREPDLAGSSWVSGAEWLYAGASPIVPGGCSCPTQRPHLDWFKRVYVPEAYRHSIGVLDTNGNLILHIGQYGNFDSGEGQKSRIPVGGDGIGMTMARMVSGTDNYLCYPDNGERITVLKLNYHAEETVGIGNQ